MAPSNGALGRYQRPIFIAIIIVILIAMFWPHSGGGNAIQKGYDKATGGSTSHSTAVGDTSTVLTDFAHKFKTADEFKPHFAKVEKLSPLNTTDAKRTCNWSPEDEQAMQFQWGPTSDWFANDTLEAESEKLRGDWQRFVREEMVPWEKAKHRFSGRGIVTLAGHADTLRREAILLRQLVRLGSTLPVEIHHWENEMNEDQMRFLTNIYPYVTFNDLSLAHNVMKTHGPTAGYGHYHFKTAAVVNTKFAQFLLLDSDNIPLVDPATLFDHPIYKEYGTLFWPDVARTRKQNPMWAITRTFCRMDEYEMESGQMVVDKRRFFYHLQLAAWFNEHDVYKHFVLGDKDMFRFAWHALKTRFGRPARWLSSAGVLHDGKYCGHTFVQPHPDGRHGFLHRGYFKLQSKASLRYFKEHGGVFNAWKESKYPTDMLYPEATRWLGDSVDGVEGAWQCMDITDAEPQPIETMYPGLDKLFEELGGYWQLDDDPFHDIGPASDGT
jgi:alpha 1,2-mannosyltransferase